MNNTITLGDSIVLTLSDEVMNKLFGGLLVSQVNNLQKQVDTLAVSMARFENMLSETDDAVEQISSSLNELTTQVEDHDFKLDDLPDFDELTGQIEELETNSNADTIGGLSSNVEDLEVKVKQIDHDINIINGIFARIGDAVFPVTIAKVA